MPQKKVTSKRGSEFRAPAPPRTHEKQLRELLAFMAEEIRQRFRENVLEEYNQSNYQKAEIGDSWMRSDWILAQYGISPAHSLADANFARDFTRLANKVKQMIQGQFPNARLRKEVEKIMQRANRDNRDRLYNSLERRIGVDRTELVKREGLQWQANARIEQVYEWVEKMRDETLEGFHRNTMQALVEGRPIDTVIEEFENTASKRKNHVQYLARTQLANYNSQMTRLRAQRLGIQKAKWITSEDERVRKCHAVRNGKEFDLEEGLYSSCDGKTLWPGSDHNCFPGSVQVNHSSLCQKLYRRWYSGVLVELVFDDGVILPATPNHPIFTINGPKGAGEIQPSDQVIRTVDQGFDRIELDGKDMTPSFEQIFGALDVAGVKGSKSPAISGKFHGDISDSEIDVVSVDSLLVDKINPALREYIAELGLSNSDVAIMLQFFTCLGDSANARLITNQSSDSIVSRLRLLRSRLLAHLSPLYLFGLALGAWADPRIEQSLSDYMPSDAKVFSDSIFAFSALVHGFDLFDREIERVRLFGASTSSHFSLAKFAGQGSRSNADFLGNVHNLATVPYTLDRVVDVRSRDFSGHVYNLQTVSSDYTANTAAVSNCRCTYMLVIPGEDEREQQQQEAEA